MKYTFNLPSIYTSLTSTFTYKHMTIYIYIQNTYEIYTFNTKSLTNTFTYKHMTIMKIENATKIH
jgi:hypothetical protein